MSASRSNPVPRSERPQYPWWLRWTREKLTLTVLFGCICVWLPVLLVAGLF